MGNGGRLTNGGEGSLDNEFAARLPQETKGLYAGGGAVPTRLAMRVPPSGEGLRDNEIPDPPPEDTK